MSRQVVRTPRYQQLSEDRPTFIREGEFAVAGRFLRRPLRGVRRRSGLTDRAPPGVTGGAGWRSNRLGAVDSHAMNPGQCADEAKNLGDLAA